MKRLSLPLVLCAALSLAACGGKPAAEPSTADAADPVLRGGVLQFPENHPQLARLGTAEAVPATGMSVSLPARLVWNEDRTQRIYAAFAGRVDRIAADVGQAVRPGSVLAQLASPDFAAASAETAKAQVDARLTQTAYARQRELFEAGVVARKDLEVAEAEAARAAAEVQRAQARTRMYGGTGGVDPRIALRSDIAGLVVERNLNPGQELRPEQAGVGVPPLFVVSDPSSLWVQIDARETEVDVLRPGARFELMVSSLPDQTFVGQVAASGDFIDPATRTLRVRGVVVNPERRLKAEMLATARVQRSVPQGVMIPAAAVKLDGTKHSVMVQVSPAAFTAREVTVAHQGPSEALVVSGLKPGEKVVTDNMLLLARQLRAAMDRPPEVNTAAAKAEAGK